MNAHIFTPTAGSKSACTECGKTRNTKEHKAAKVAAETTEAQGFSEPYDEAQAEDEGILSDAQAAEEYLAAEATNEEVASEQAQAEHDAVDAEAEAEAAAQAEQAKPKPVTKKAAAKGPKVASVWLGWRIANAAVLGKGSLVKKIQDAKPTADLDRTVKLTEQELDQLDAVAAKFMETGKTGPEVYSGRTLRRRIAEAKARLQARG